jgi:hypothetical protein
MMIPVDRDNLRDALIAAAVGLTLAWLLSSCAAQPQLPPLPTATQLTQVTTPAPTTSQLSPSAFSRGGSA